MKSRTIKACVRLSLLATLALLPAAITGCSGAGEFEDPESVSDEAGPLDQSVLENALLNESQFESGGYELEGRAWLARDVALSFYVDADQNHMVSLLVRAGADAEPERTAPLEGETFAEFVARKGQGHERTLADVASAGPNVLLFDPEAAAPSNTNRLASISRNDYCPLSWFNSHCSLWAGWNHPKSHPSFPFSFRTTERTSYSAQSFPGVTGLMAVACADLGTVDFSIYGTNARFGTVAGTFTVTIYQGNAHMAWITGTYREEEYCKTRVLGICADYAFRVKFQTFTANATVSPWLGSEAHFCGTTTKNEDYYQGDWSCFDLAQCPAPCPPGDTSVYCTSR